MKFWQPKLIYAVVCAPEFDFERPQHDYAYLRSTTEAHWYRCIYCGHPRRVLRAEARDAAFR